MTKTYRTLAGDTWDGIAFRCYGDGKQTHALLEANPAHIATAVFSAGIVLVLPDAPEPTSPALPPWKRRGTG